MYTAGEVVDNAEVYLRRQQEDGQAMEEESIAQMTLLDELRRTNLNYDGLRAELDNYRRTHGGVVKIRRKYYWNFTNTDINEIFAQDNLKVITTIFKIVIVVAAFIVSESVTDFLLSSFAALILIFDTYAFVIDRVDGGDE